MRVLNPLMFRPKMILVYKGSNHVIHNSSDSMSHQHAILIESIKIDGGESLKWCLQFKILDVTLLLVFYGQKVYQLLEQEGEKRYIHLPESYYYFNETPDEKKIVINGLLIYNRQYSEKCIIEERFKYQITFSKDQKIYRILETSKRMMEEEMEI